MNGYRPCTGYSTRRLCKLVVYILVDNALAVFLFRYPAYPVRVQVDVGDCLLGGVRLSVPLCLSDCGGDLFLLAAGQFPLLLLKDSAGTSAAAFVMIVVMLPCFLMAMYEKHGQPLETVVKNIIQTKFVRPKERPYQTQNLYAVLEKQRKLEKEVSAIVKGTNPNDLPLREVESDFCFYL